TTVLPVSSCHLDCYGLQRDLHSFPTRRSSDLTQAASRAGTGASREAATSSGVVVSRTERAANGSAKALSAPQWRPYSARSLGGRSPAVASRWAGTSTRIGVGSEARRITCATSLAGAVTEIVSLAIWVEK